MWGGRIGAGRFQSASASVPVGPRWAAPPKLWAASCFPAAGTGTCPRTCTPCPLLGLYKIFNFLIIVNLEEIHCYDVLCSQNNLLSCSW